MSSTSKNSNTIYFVTVYHGPEIITTATMYKEQLDFLKLIMNIGDVYFVSYPIAEKITNNQLSQFLGYKTPATVIEEIDYLLDIGQ